jgi:maltose alpha-D-glucosyltransferase/alpha-amylase
MHMALASRNDITAFRPEPVTATDTQGWIDILAVRAESVFGSLRQTRVGAKEADRVLIDRVLACREDLRGRLEALLPGAIDVHAIRHHGDFHLGQMLIAKDDIFIIDFEGEPRRPIAERRHKAPAARDVAGLIRSLDYAATAALERALQVAPDDHGKLATALDGWRERAVASFVVGYRETMSDDRLWPTDADAAERLLRFFLLEKALYEIEYELAHRPAWLRVPLSGMLRILSEPNEAPA